MTFIAERMTCLVGIAGAIGIGFLIGVVFAGYHPESFPVRNAGWIPVYVSAERGHHDCTCNH